jgi:hypothetical protein
MVFNLTYAVMAAAAAKSTASGPARWGDGRGA